MRYMLNLEVVRECYVAPSRIVNAQGDSKPSWGLFADTRTLIHYESQEKAHSTLERVFDAVASGARFLAIDEKDEVHFT